MGARRTRSAWARPAIALAVLGSLIVLAPADPAAGAQLYAGDVLVDDAGGHVFETTGDTVRVYDLAGKQVKSIAGQTGAIDLMLRGRTLYVVAAGIDRINSIDADTLAVTGGWSVAVAPGPRNLAWSNGRIWFTYGTDDWQYTGGIGMIDPTTGSVVVHDAGGIGGAGDIVARDSPARLYLYAGPRAYSFDVATRVPKRLADTEALAGFSGSELALSADGTKLWLVCGCLTYVNELDAATLSLADPYALPGHPYGVLGSADGRFLVGGVFQDGDVNIVVWRDGIRTPLKAISNPAHPAMGSIAMAADSTRIYYADGASDLHVIDLLPVVTSTAPDHVLEASGAAFTVRGTGLSDVTSVKVGTTSAAFTLQGDGSLRVTTPSVAPGTYAIVLDGTFGTNVPSAAASVTVDALPPGAPAAPSITGTPLWAVSLGWSAPPAATAAVTSYVVKAYPSGSSTAERLVVVDGTSTTVGSLVAGRSYRFTVAARNSGGTGPESPKSAPAAAGSPDLGPFLSPASFVSRQYLDLVGRAASAAEVAGRAKALSEGPLTPAAYLTALRRGSDATANVDPVTRLYRAAFLRIPDRAGLDHWIYAKRKGQSLRQISEVFAASSEFKTRYGSLTNRKLVERLYLNVLGRPGDPGGIDYWTGLLDSRKKTRGQVITGMSESNQYKLAQAAEVDVSVLYVAMLRRAPTAAEFSAAVEAIDAGGTAADLAGQILTSPAYASRIAAL